MEEIAGLSSNFVSKNTHGHRKTAITQRNHVFTLGDGFPKPHHNSPLLIHENTNGKSEVKVLPVYSAAPGR